MEKHKIISLSFTIPIMLLFLFGLYNMLPKPHQYQVKIDYCDGRKSKTLVVTADIEPSNKEISTYREATPRYAGEVNVCNVTLLKTLDNEHSKTDCFGFRNK